MSQPRRRDYVWWGSLILVIYGVALAMIMMMIMVMYLSNPILPEGVAQIGNTFAELQDTNPGLANYIWWVQNAFALPGFIYPALFTIALAWKGLRNRQKWAWYAILIPNLPFWILFYVGCRALTTTYVEHYLVLTPFFVLFLIGIILPARQILARKVQGT